MINHNPHHNPVPFSQSCGNWKMAAINWGPHRVENHEYPMDNISQYDPWKKPIVLPSTFHSHPFLYPTNIPNYHPKLSSVNITFFSDHFPLQISGPRYERSPRLGVTRSGGAALGKSVSPPGMGRSWSPPGAGDEEISPGASFVEIKYPG